MTDLETEIAILTITNVCGLIWLISQMNTNQCNQGAWLKKLDDTVADLARRVANVEGRIATQTSKRI